MVRRMPRMLATAAVVAVLAGCSGSGYGESSTPNDVQQSPTGGASVSTVPNVRNSAEVVSPSGAPG